MTTSSLGICVGASNIKAVELLENNGIISVGRITVVHHESNPQDTFVKLTSGFDLTKYDYGMLTGRKFRDISTIPSITEAESIEYGLQYLSAQKQITNEYSALVSLGAENFIAFLLNKDGAISNVETGNKCASGTGEFFLQQIRRMNIGVDEAIEEAKKSEHYKVSGRCSVFCKSDCTHALNKGVPVGSVAAGLSRMMSEKVLDLLGKIETKKILAIGGVTKNEVVMHYIADKVEKLTIPQYADVFEALGAAYYALINKSGNAFNQKSFFKPGKSSFSFLPPLHKGCSNVEFRTLFNAAAVPNDECILGLDVGSTTTKAVLLRLSDDSILASVYLRTNGNPVKAARECYAAIDKQINVPVTISGLATTGSGRQIAGLHAQTDAIINEIIAHATGAAFFDSEVDTIIEIGGQDAKYTYLTNSVPSDYAMNEACSAGTGSFLEESAKESLGIDCKEIADIALQGTNPPNFNDQCAAFISSDIKTATHEGISREDIVAGLVYSICMNYVNRVKGQRPVGKKIFMQGGVCYNKAVPLAMANLLERPVIIPPEPGLIGAFGVAMELRNRINAGLISKSSFDLKELINRDIEIGNSFVCKGGTEQCDRACTINMITVNNKKYPFGGACNKYYNMLHHVSYNSNDFDYVRIRQDLLFNKYFTKTNDSDAKTIGIPRTYLTNLLLPLYSTFFASIGISVVLSDDVDPEGVKRRRSSFCFPGEIAHGCFYNLLKKKTDYIFLPKVMGLNVDQSVNPTREHQSTCVLLQSESYYIQSAFRKDIPESCTLVTPLLDFTFGYDSQKVEFVKLAATFGIDQKKAEQAYTAGVAKQKEFNDELKHYGRQALDKLKADPKAMAVVLFGRQYNAFAVEANMGIPSKFASRGCMVLPWDMLPFEKEECHEDMCWALGQNLLKVSLYVKKHPQLFGSFVTNFSCGPDSFIVGYFRDIMKSKPSLTLELDSHTADAGVNTRIEAFLDIVNKYRELSKGDSAAKPFTPARITYKGTIPHFVTSDNKVVSFLDKRVHLLIPSMGRLSSEILAASFTGVGVRSSAIPVYDHEALKLGRGNSSCKECLPLQLTVGGVLKYLKHRTDPSELVAYFMPFTPGNCRFPQYRVFLNEMIRKNRLENVSVFSLTAEKGYVYEAFKPLERLPFLKGFIIADVMEDIKNALSVLAVDKTKAISVFEEQWNRIVTLFENKQSGKLYKLLESVVEELRAIPLKRSLVDARKVSLIGEIFVRRDYFSCQNLLETLEKRDIVVKRSHFFEWTKYVDYIIEKGIYESNFNFKEWMQFKTKLVVQNVFEKKIKKIMATSGLFEYETINIDNIVKLGSNFFDMRFRGESILAVGGFFKDIVHHTHGVISIGPFACMPTRVIESVLSADATTEMKQKLDKSTSVAELDIQSLPFLPIESDGNPFPQIIEARVEAFCLQVERLHSKVKQPN